MKFSENGLYIESYIKCGTCGALIYEGKDRPAVTVAGVTYCSEWCLAWKTAREQARAQGNDQQPLVLPRHARHQSAQGEGSNLNF